MEKKIIAIVAGGDSSEHDVSLRSAQGILGEMDLERFEPYIIELSAQAWTAILPDGTKSPVNRQHFTFTDASGKEIKPEMAYIIIHGTPGEDGTLQGYFELIGMPYSTGPLLTEALTFNKFALNNFLKTFGVNTAENMLVRRGHEQLVTDDEVVNHIGLPCFIKPNAGGSSFGVTKVKTRDQIRPALEKALNESDEAIIESLLQGTEITCGCFKTERGDTVLPITEVVTQNEFFDYNAKYNGQVSEITPARIDEEVAERVRLITSAIYDILNCRGIIRVDYILSPYTDENGEQKTRINMLEVNTTPGMTPTSFIPQQIRAAGLTVKDVLTEIIEDQLARAGR